MLLYEDARKVPEIAPCAVIAPAEAPSNLGKCKKGFRIGDFHALIMDQDMLTLTEQKGIKSYQNTSIDIRRLIWP